MTEFHLAVIIVLLVVIFALVSISIVFIVASAHIGDEEMSELNTKISDQEWLDKLKQSAGVK